MFVTKEVQTKGKKFYFEFVDMEKACDTLSRSMSNSSPVHVFEPFFWTGQLLDNFRLNDQAICHGSISNADHTSCRSRDMMLFGYTKAICELKGIYNV